MRARCTRGLRFVILSRIGPPARLGGTALSVMCAALTAWLVIATSGSASACPASTEIKGAGILESKGEFALAVDLTNSNARNVEVEVAYLGTDHQLRSLGSVAATRSGQFHFAHILLPRDLGRVLEVGGSIQVVAKVFHTASTHSRRSNLHDKRERVEVSSALLRVGGSARPSAAAIGADRVVFVFFALILFGVLLAYRREGARCDRVRLAAAGGLISILFLCTTQTMAWTVSPEVDGLRGLCQLGFEADCLGAFRAIETVGLAGFIRAGQLLLLLTMIPSFIWLLVDPRSRPAQLFVIVGALPAVSLAAATWAYYASLGTAAVRRAGAADITLLATLAVTCASLVALRYAVAGDQEADSVPSVTLRKGD